jgi:hypothetical protein
VGSPLFFVFSSKNEDKIFKDHCPEYKRLVIFAWQNPEAGREGILAATFGISVILNLNQKWQEERKTNRKKKFS